MFAILLWLFMAQAMPPAECHVHGRITLRDTGEPVAGVAVALVRTVYSVDGEPSIVFGHDTFSNFNGEYAIDSSDRSYHGLVTGVRSKIGDIYVPVSLEVPEGCSKPAELNIAIKRGHEVAIRGKFIDGLGHRYPHLDWVWVEPRNTLSPSPLGNEVPLAHSWKAHYKNAEGYTIEGLLPGAYNVHGFRFDEITDREETIIPIDVEDRDLDVDIVSEKSYRLDGRVRFSGVRFPLQKLRIGACSLERVHAKPCSLTTVRTDGTFEVSEVPAGKSRLVVSKLPAPFYLKSVKRGSVDVLNGGFSVPTASAASLVVDIASNGGWVTGSVHATNTSGLIQVVLIPEHAHLIRVDLYHVAEADESGNFALAGVAPGRYRIYAWPEEAVADRNYFDPQFMKGFESRGTFVDVLPSSETRVTLKVLE